MEKVYFFFLCLVFLNSFILGEAWVCRHGLTSAGYQAEFNKWTSQGYRLIQISGYSESDKALYAAIFEKTPNPPAWVARHGLPQASYQEEVNKWTSQGYRPVQVSGYAVGNQIYYAAIFEKVANPSPWTARHGLSASEYQTEFDKWTNQGYRLTDVSAYSLQGKAYYAAIWEKSANPPAWSARHGMSSELYQAEFQKHADQGYRLKKVSGYSISGKVYYAAIWEKSGQGAWIARHGLTRQEYQDDFDRFFYQGYRPAWIAGYNVNGKPYYAGIWECYNGFLSEELKAVDQLAEKFMQEYNVPGLSFAITKDGKLVLVKTYGYANKGLQEKVAPRHLFRIASVSKPITAVAIMKLIELKKLKLTDRIFGTNSILGTQYGTTPYKKHVEEITLQHLLEHTSGGWSGGDDTLGLHSPFSQAKLIGWTLDHRTLENVPGTNHAYSNFGYCVLGRIIEKVTGTTYENYVKTQILAPCGIENMSIGGDTQEELKPNEIKYYGQDSENPYSICVTRSDAAGGWIASPIDLVRLLVRVDRFPTKPDILTDATLTTMYTPCSVFSSYAKGWAVNSAPNYWHGGSAVGQQSIIARTSSGYCWAILINTRTGKKGFVPDFDKLMWDIVGKITKWPSWDLF